MPKRIWRPKFSVRTLVILVTLVSAYFGCWELTKRYGLRHLDYDKTVDILDIPPTIFDSSPAPFVVSCAKWDDPISLRSSRDVYATEFVALVPLKDTERHREYHIWFFGYTKKVFSRDLTSDENQSGIKPVY